MRLPRVSRALTLAAFVVSLTACALVCVRGAGALWPVIDGDGPAYFPPAVEWSLHRPLTNPVWPPPLNDSLDGPGGRRYIYHGFTYALVVGAIGRAFGGGPAATVRAAYLVHWMAAGLTAAAVLAWIESGSWLALWLALLLPPSMLALSLAWHGRVEPLAMAIIGLVCLARRFAATSLADAIAGAACGLLVFTSPALGLLSASLLLALVIKSPMRRVALQLRHLVLGAAAGSALALWAYPYPIGVWIGGVRRHAQLNLSLPLGQGFVPTWITRLELPLLILTVSGVALAAVPALSQMVRGFSRARRVLFGVAILAFAVGLFRIALVKTEASYNATVWIPLGACLAVSSDRRWARALVASVLVFPALGMLRSTVLLAAQSRPGVASFADVQARIRQVTPFGCAISPGLWLAADEPARLQLVGRDVISARFQVRQQADTGLSHPISLPGYRLIEDRFSPPVTLLGVPLSRGGGGWGFAVYERSPSAQEGTPPVEVPPTPAGRATEVPHPR